jgi:hypothetical protein
LWFLGWLFGVGVVGVHVDFGDDLDASTGKVLAKLSGRSDPTVLLDGKRIFTTGPRGEGELYSLDFDELLAHAKSLLPIDSGR